ncbi:LuxR C-terminal-related transcriptional regulator [Streptomyces cyaneofuscatus]
MRLLTPREREVFHLLARGKSNMDPARGCGCAGPRAPQIIH